MATNEGVGKKIVEALKKQTNPELEFSNEMVDISEDVEQNENNFISDDMKSEDNVFSSSNVQGEEAIMPYGEDKFEIKEVEEKVEFVSEPEPQMSAETPQGWNFEVPQESQPVYRMTQPMETEVQQAKQFDMPPNVAVLKKLIMQLPSGVTKQTGAQIIKQTMEALGISMNTVLHEAQKVQDDMNESIKNCMLSIQEYKNNIKSLEKQGLDYQRQVNQLNDLISLFILSDKD